MSQSTNTLLYHRPGRMITSLQNIVHGLKLSSTLYSKTIYELLVQLEKASTPYVLNKTVNRMQEMLWKMPSKEQAVWRDIIVSALSIRVLQARREGVRLEAAKWLRLFVQAGLVAKPEDIFITLVTSSLRVRGKNTLTNTNEQKTLLKLLFQCFWSFRFPYPAYSWELFPKNEVFYPLATLFAHADIETQDLLMCIFSEIPTLDDEEILEYVLPVALQWANHANAELRSRVTNILARINQPETKEALDCLTSDADSHVRQCAKGAADYVRTA